jgi:hypothetical protein
MLSNALNRTVAIFKTNPRLTGNVKIVLEDSHTAYFTQLSAKSYEYSALRYSKTGSYAANVANFLSNYVKSDKYFIDKFDFLYIGEKV